MTTISAAIFMLFVVFTIITYGYSLLKNKSHVMLCIAFREKFGYLPNGIILAQAGGLFLTFQKDFYFIFPLIVRKGSFIVRGMKSDHYDFIRSLPKELTGWLKVKFSLFFITCIMFFASLATHYFMVKP